MRTQYTRLSSPSLGTRREVVSLHFGAEGAAQKAYLQSSLHADELPGMLVMHHLRHLLEHAEREGRLVGEIVLVPVANPIGLDQALLYQGLGRFELSTAQNFNRGFPDFLALLGESIDAELGPDAQNNRAVIRQRLREALDGLRPASELESLQIILARLACDADIVLDLHCDEESILHLYTEKPYWAQAEPLARYLGAEASLLALGQGARSFDEALSGVWWQLQERLARRAGDDVPVPLACLAATIEYRGQADVEPALASQDAARLFSFLQFRGLIRGAAPVMPDLIRPATPLAGTEEVRAPHAGILYFLKSPGDWIEAGEVVAEIVDPLADTTTAVAARVTGLLYGRLRERYATPNRVLCRITGAHEFRTGNLLSP
jgi:predicted deacylase